YTVLIPRAWASSGVAGATGAPSSTMLPASGVSTPVTSLIRVDLPAPFWPIRAWISPARRLSPAPSRATVAPKRLRRPEACSTTGFMPRPRCRERAGQTRTRASASVLAVRQLGGGLVLRVHALLDHHPLGHLAAGMDVADQLRQLLAQQRIALHGGVELAGLHRLERTAHAVDGDDADVAARLEPGFPDGLDSADGHVVVVREQHVDAAAFGLEEGFHHFLALGPGEVAALRAHDLEARVGFNDFLEAAHAVVGRRRAD